MLQLFVAGLVAAAVIVESADVCPTDPPGLVYACANRPQCLGDRSCGSGHKCCPHICGSRCFQTVHCDPIDCGSLTCNYGFQPDSRGCKSCTCRTSKPCTTLLCRLSETLG
ncbi:keratin-associated protein 9-1-like isoform X1 [Haliotis rubra]|uniref:keratin-associated protein 9-1-like isoform X1 n=1 Tax=Haliotis rubra TaxID=36100 RepID=UPI001EE61F9D|nr:keratin-associated protein 9-1-like isoform X1 [Haliotis rubra]